MNFEQLLFLEIFELPHKFESNLGFKSSGNFVILVNSDRGRHLTAGGLLLVSRRARGHLWLHTGVEKTVAWLLLASELCYKVYDAAVFRRSSPLFFPSPPPLLR